VGGQGSGPPRSANSPDRGHRDWYQLERWRKLAKAQLRREPLCARCLDAGRVTRRRSLIMSLGMVATGIGFCSASCKAFARHAIPAASSLKRYRLLSRHRPGRLSARSAASGLSPPLNLDALGKNGSARRGPAGSSGRLSPFCVGSQASHLAGPTRFANQYLASRSD
jgi:hypothetical protein